CLRLRDAPLNPSLWASANLPEARTLERQRCALPGDGLPRRGRGRADLYKSRTAALLVGILLPRNVFRVQPVEQEWSSVTRCPAEVCSPPTQLVSPEAQYPAASPPRSPLRSALSPVQMLPGGPAS